jgi:predicted membrane-bound spermidine synthase
MSLATKNTLAVFFFLSGFCGLLYQIIWVRLAFASFGIITPVMSVVISVFMLGLGLGSWAGGKLISSWVKKTNQSAIVFYAIAEIIIGIGGLLVPWLFDLGEQALFPMGGMGSVKYLFFSAIIITMVIFPWCVAMGLTFPFMMAFVKERDPRIETSFSFLYLANVLGAMIGAVTTAVILIELFGFSQCLFMAACMNFFIGVACLQMGKKSYLSNSDSLENTVNLKRIKNIGLEVQTKYSHLILFTTGFAALAMEVTWARAFAPVLGNKVYSFSMLLTTYLFATFAGTSLYRLHIRNNKSLSLPYLLGLSFVFSFLPIVLMDPRYAFTPETVLASIIPFSAVLGYMTPKLIDEYTCGNPESAGKTYAVNILGSILGPLIVAYFFLPTYGVRFTLILLAAPFFIFYLMHWKEHRIKVVAKLGLMTSGLVLAVISIFFNINYENPGYYNGNRLLVRDHTATVIASGTGMMKRLMVNGVDMTRLTPITKVMAHFPLSVREKKPQSALFIALGMGTTFRSMASWDISVTGIELLPSVKEVFPYFFADALDVLKDPQVNIIVDDGRRFLKRTEQKFDVISVDPPPPIESAGSSLLYSKEFYQAVRNSLSDDGIFHHWFPSGEKKILHAIVRSLDEEFPYVRSYTSINDWGVHFLASKQPFETPTAEEMAQRMPEKAKMDLVEWASGVPANEIIQKIVTREFPLLSLLDSNEDLLISDDKPFNEYYLLRRNLPENLRKYL